MFKPFRSKTAIHSQRYGCTRSVSDARPFRPGDLVLLRDTRGGNGNGTPLLCRPLTPGKRLESHRGVIPHDDILGKRVRDNVEVLPKRIRDSDRLKERHAVPLKQPARFRLHEVRLEDYVRLTDRLVTPIYPADARLIVELLDLHPEALRNGGDGEEYDEQRLEILEAGTGHGALTLYLARAIAGANHTINRNTGEKDEAALTEWKKQRRAVLHTVDISPKYAAHAEKIVKGFRRGLYHPHVDFNVGNVGDWLAEQQTLRSSSSSASSSLNEPEHFLSHAFLDLLNADAHLAAVAKALRMDGTLVVFTPNITQINEAAVRVKEDGIPLELEKVIELGVNGGTGGREWDVRPVRPHEKRSKKEEKNGEGEGDAGTVVELGGGPEREMGWAAKLQGEAETQTAPDGEAEAGRDEDTGVVVAAKPELVDEEKVEPKQGWKVICRPKVGDRIQGGGFLGVWKKQRARDDAEPEEGQSRGGPP